MAHARPGRVWMRSGTLVLALLWLAAPSSVAQGTLTVRLTPGNAPYTKNPGSSLGVQLFSNGVNVTGGPDGIVLGDGPTFGFGVRPYGSYRVDACDQGGIQIGQRLVDFGATSGSAVDVQLLTKRRLSIRVTYAGGQVTVPAGYKVRVVGRDTGERSHWIDRSRRPLRRGRISDRSAGEPVLHGGSD